MYTESELRDMLKASADRVPAAGSASSGQTGHARVGIFEPTLLEPTLLEPTLLEPTLLDTERARRRARKVVAPIAVAAVTVVVAGVVTLVARQGSGTHEPAAGGPPVATSTSSSAAPVRSRDHQALTPVIDGVTVKTANPTLNLVEPVGDDKHGQQLIQSELPHDRQLNLVLAPADAFDGSGVSQAHPVSIAGTTGHYAVLKLYPLSANGDGGSAPTGTIVFHTPDAHWAFVYLKKGTKNDTLEGSPVDDPSAIVRAYDTLNATFVSNRFRTPLRLDYLPGNTRFTEADETTTSAPGVQTPSLTLHDGDRQLEVSLWPTRRDQVDGENCHRKVLGMCTTSYHRPLAGGGQIEVQGIGYSAAETAKVVDNVVVATDLADRSTYFTLADAIG